MANPCNWGEGRERGKQKKNQKQKPQNVTYTSISDFYRQIPSSKKLVWGFFNINIRFYSKLCNP